ncbi:MAG: PstS family phosphate ABC transporter substrate-binding protein [Thermomicrobiales bacterium]
MIRMIARARQEAMLALLLSLVMTLAAGSVGLAQEASPPADTAVTPYTPPDNAGDLSGTIEVDGSSTVGPITEAIAEEFLAVAPDVQVPVSISGTGGGFSRFCQGETDVQDASRPITTEGEVPDNEALTCAENGVEFYEFQVATDGLAVVVNPANDFVDCLTVEELRTIWAPDSEITTWNQVREDFPEEEIALYGPGPDSGTFDYFTEAIVGEEGATRTDYIPSEDDNALVEGVAGDEFALGYFGLAYVQQNPDAVTAIGVDNGAGCVEPTPETVADGSYAPLSRPIFIYVKAESLQRPEVQEFVRFYLATVGDLIADVGYVSSGAEIYAAEQAELEGAIAGTVPPMAPLGATPEA